MLLRINSYRPQAQHHPKGLPRKRNSRNPQNPQNPANVTKSTV